MPSVLPPPPPRGYGHLNLSDFFGPVAQSTSVNLALGRAGEAKGHEFEASLGYTVSCVSKAPSKQHLNGGIG